MTITVRGPTSMSISARNWEDDSAAWEACLTLPRIQNAKKPTWLSRGLKTQRSLLDFAMSLKREKAYLTLPWVQTWNDLLDFATGLKREKAYLTAMSLKHEKLTSLCHAFKKWKSLLDFATSLKREKSLLNFAMSL